MATNAQQAGESNPRDAIDISDNLQPDLLDDEDTISTPEEVEQAQATSDKGDTFQLSYPFIYTTKAEFTPMYHVSTRNMNSGEPWQLQISRLLPSEVRRLGETRSDGIPHFIRYDDDLTLYLAQKLVAPISINIGKKSQMCITGSKKGTLRGKIIMLKLSGRGKAYKFVHMTPIIRETGLAAEAKYRALMEKRGYHTSDDWRSELLFHVKEAKSKGLTELIWTDEYKAVVAVEKDQLTMTTNDALEQERRDLLLTCWASKAWIQENMLAENKPSASSS